MSNTQIAFIELFPEIWQRSKALIQSGSRAINQLSMAYALGTHNTLPTMHTYRYLGLLALLYSLFGISAVSAAESYCRAPDESCLADDDCCFDYLKCTGPFGHQVSTKNGHKFTFCS